MEDTVKEEKRGLKASTTLNDSARVQDDLWNQLGNAVSMAAKEDQIVWTIFGIFWAANAVLLVALFTTGTIPNPFVGIVVSTVGTILSWVWFFVQRRAIGWLAYYERIIQKLEEKHLNIPREIALSGYLNEKTFNETVGQGVRVRPLMIGSGIVIAIQWMAALLWFAWQAAA
jgi:hypothetical protein